MKTIELMDYEQQELIVLLRQKLHAEEYLASTVPGQNEHGYHARMCIRLLEIVQPRTPDRQDRDFPKAVPIMPASTHIMAEGFPDSAVPITT